MVLRHRKPTNVQETVQNVVQELDAFVKVEEHYVEQSVLGAVGMTLNFLLSLTKEFNFSSQYSNFVSFYKLLFQFTL